VAQTLRKWGELNQAARNYESSLAVNAKAAPAAVQKRSQQDLLRSLDDDPEEHSSGSSDGEERRQEPSRGKQQMVQTVPG
jgi:hypothetical protein